MDTEPTKHDLAPILRSEVPMLEVQLKNGSFEEKCQALYRLSELGQMARPLIPVVLSMIDQRESSFTAHLVIKLLGATGDDALVGALRTANLLHGLDTWDQVTCFRHGAEELEAGLRSFIWQQRHTVGNPARSVVVKALGEKGGHEALNMMKALSVELSDCNEVPGQGASDIFIELEMKGQVRLRSEIRHAIRQLEERGVA